MVDEEKGNVPGVVGNESSSLEHKGDNDATESPTPQLPGSFLQRLNDRILAIKFLEKRGFERVPESERHEITASRYMQFTLLWFSTNITANNIAVGMLGPLSYDLGFTDSALCAAFGAMLGAAGAAYISTFGPQSGNRTMVGSLSAIPVFRVYEADCFTLGYRKVFHGLLSEQDMLPAQYSHHAWLRHD